MLKRNPFIIPSAPVLKRQPPTGPQWLHEVKFDGWRAQLHKAGDEVAIYTRKGHDYTKRFPAIRDSLLAPASDVRPSSMPRLSCATATASPTSRR